MNGLLGLIRRPKNPSPVPIDQAQTKELCFTIGGSKFNLTIPENVSPDMPPTELVPHLDISTPEVFKDSKRIPLMKVLYDFPRPGWRKRNYGSMAVSVWVCKISDEFTGDIFDRNQLIEAIQVDLKSMYQAFNEKVWQEGLAAGKLSINLVDEMMNFPGYSDESFEDHDFNGSHWVTHVITGLETHGLYYTPLTRQHYVCVDFEHMGDNDVYLGQLLEFSVKYEEAIIRTAKLSLSGSPSDELSSGIVVEGDKL